MTQSSSKSKFPQPTNEDTMGPYYPIPFCDQATVDISVYHPGIICEPQGTKVLLKGRVLDRHGMLAAGVLLEFWQPNAKGVYRTPETEGEPDVDPWFSGHARLRSPEGRFALKTIKPGAGTRAPHITLTIFSDGIVRLVTQLFFDDEPSNANDVVLGSLPERLRSRLIATFDGQMADGTKVYTIDIVMAGEGETPFFDDQRS